MGRNWKRIWESAFTPFNLLLRRKGSEKMIANRKLALKAMAIVAIIASVLVAAFTVAADPRASIAQKAATPLCEDRLFNRPWPGFGNQSRHGNVTITSAQAKALVEATIPSFRVGTVTSSKTGWLVPIEDGKGVVTSIEVGKVSASTAEQAKAIVEESLKKGWKAGEPRLMGTVYSVPLLDSKDATIGFVSVDGRSGEVMRRPSTILTVTSQQAKTIVSDAIKEFKVGEAKDGGSVWMVSIKYKDKAVMTVLLGKLNTPTSEDAVKAVQASLGKGWSAGEPKQLQIIYNVPIIDANNNTVGTISVDGRTGNITAGMRPSR